MIEYYATTNVSHVVCIAGARPRSPQIWYRWIPPQRGRDHRRSPRTRPGSQIESSRNLPSRATRHNYRHAVVSGLSLKASIILLTVFPMRAYSFIDPVLDLSSTSWLLNQPGDYQQRHIPVPYEEDHILTQSHPPFPTPARFSDPLQIGGGRIINLAGCKLCRR